jgi:hypothetical protein
MEKKKITKKPEERTLENAKEDEAKHHNKILRNILIIVSILIIASLSFVFISKSVSQFDYKGVKFEKVRFCDAGPPCLVLYKTTLPVKISNGSAIIAMPSESTNVYQFYFRNDPRKSEVDFNGTIRFGKNMVFNSEDAFTCDGDGGLAGANFNLLFKVLGTNVVRDENVTCDSLERYVFVDAKLGNETKIEQFGPGCYNIYINNCEVLEGTEKFMIDTLVRVNQALKE